MTVPPPQPATGPAGCYRHPQGDPAYCPAHMSRHLADADPSAPVCMDRASFARMDLDTWRSGYVSALRYDPTHPGARALARAYRDAIRTARRTLRAARYPIPPARLTRNAR